MHKKRDVYIWVGILIISISLFITKSSCYAQQHVSVFLRKYSQQEGLSSFYARQIIQDKYGFLYIATQEGLDRFDGKQFIHYRKTNPAYHRLAGIDIRTMVEDPASNLLWVLPGENGVNAINTITGKVTKFIPVERDNENEWNLALFLYNGKLLIGTSVGVKVYDIKNDIFLQKLALYESKPQSEPAYQVRAINSDANGNLWVCYSGYGIVVYDRNLQRIGFIANSEFNIELSIKDPVRFNRLVFTGNNSALAATSKGLRKIIFNSSYKTAVNKTPCLAGKQVNDFPVQNICITRNGSIYIAGSKELYYFDTSLTKYSVIQDAVYEEGNNWLANVINVFEDRDNNIWIGSNQGLAFFKTTNNAFSTIYQSSNTDDRLEHATSLFVTDKKEMFIGLFNGLAVSKAPYTSFSVIDKEYMFYQVFEDKNRLIHVSRSDRMFIYKNNRLEPVEMTYPEFKPYCKTPVNSHVFLNDSLIILGTENYSGILIWNYKQHTVTRMDEKSGSIKLGSGIVNALYKDGKENVWVLSDNVITILPNSLMSSSVLQLNDTKSKLPAGLFFDMCEFAGKYWIASYGTGIIELNGDLKINNIYTSTDGLSNDGVYKIFPDKNNLVITTNYGLSVLSLNSKTFKNYYRADGLHSNNFEEAVGHVKNRIIYTGGLRGVSVINPDLLSSNTKAPEIYINRINLETSRGNIDSTNLFFHTYSVPNNTSQTTIYFSGINYSNPERTIFAYRIKEEGKVWINLNVQNFVSLIGLSPGKYHIEIKAANEDGVWSEPKELILEFLPKWYQTWWFKLLVLLTTAGIIYAFYRYRIRQIEKQHAIRKNIATDLHDDLGSTLNSVKVFTNLAISGVKQEESLQQVKDNLTEATMSLRDMIWVLDDSLDTVDELVTRLKQFAFPITAASNMEFVITADSDVNSRTLTKEEKRNLFLICKEAINNSIKYSGATQITVAILPAGKKIQITVADNGKGFDETAVKKGYGLKNMQYRAGQVKFKATLYSSTTKGTYVQLTPL